MVGEAESGSKAVTVIKVMPAAGGAARDLRRGVRPSWRGLEWTPDGLSLLFAQRARPAGSKADLWLILVRGGQPRKLDLTAEGLREVSIHPDGRHIAFTAVQERSEIWVMENFLPQTK